MTTSPAPAADAEPETGDSTGLVTRLCSKLKPPRLLSLTRAGKFFLLITLAVGFGAINTGNNLLFLLLGMMLSLTIASGLLSEAVLRNLAVRRQLPTRARAGTPAPGTFRVVNQGWWPALSVEASERNPRAVEGPAEDTVFGPERIPWWKFWRRQTGEDRRPQAASYCLRINPEEEQSLSPRYELPTRGRYELPGLQLKTRFPFGLFEKTRQFDAPSEITVLPRRADADRWIGQLESRWGDTAENRRGRSHEFYGLRDYRPGEDRRLIHWKSTARRGEPVIRETEARQRKALLVVFDTRAPDDTATDMHHRQFERGVRHLVGLLHALQHRGYRTRLATPDGVIDPGAEGDIAPLLRHLAVVCMKPSDAPGPLTDGDDSLPTMRLHIGFAQHLPAESDNATALAVDELSAPDQEAS